MTVKELIAALKACDPKAPVYLYDAEYDVAFQLNSVSTRDPRANKGQQLHKHAVFVGEGNEA